MICEAQRSGHTVRIPAADLWKMTGYFLPQHGVWKGKAPSKLFGLNTGDVCEFVGWYLAEGWATHNYNGVHTSLCIGQSQEANPEKCWRIEKLLSRLGFTWSRLSGNDGYIVHKSAIPIPLFDLLVAQRGAKNKRVPALFFDLSPELIDRLLSSMIAGDGNIHDEHSQGTFPKVNYYTISKGLADDVQILALLCGLHARVRSRVRVGAGGIVEEGRQIQAQNRCYEVTICGAARAKYDRSYKEIVEYNDVAFCVTVKNHAIYARRNGTACWTGNSNYQYPLTAQNVDPILARLLRTVHATTNLWTVTALNAQWANVAKPVQDFLAYIDGHFIKMHDVNYRVLMEMCKLGTGVYKTGWKYEAHKVQGYDQDMQRMSVIREYNQPIVDQVHMANFLVPPEAVAISPDAQGGAQWVAERFRFRPEQLAGIGKAQEPALPNFDATALAAVMNYQEAAPTLYEQRVQQLDNMSGAYSRKWRRPIEIWEVHARFDTTGNGFEEDIVVLWHHPTRTILRTTYNPFAHGKRPYHVARYVRGDGFYGIGLGEQLQSWQMMMTDILNYDIDKVLLEHAPMLIAKEGANLLPNETFYPGKTIFVQDPSKDFMPFRWSQGGNSEVLGLLSYIQEGAKARSGLTDLQFGSVGAVPSRTPATTVQALLQEGNTRFDMMIQDLRLNALGPVGLQTLQNIVQQVGDHKNNPSGQDFVELAAMVLGEKPGQLVDALIQLPHDRVEAGLGVELTATSGTNNKELQRQSYLALLQVFGQWGPQLVQLATVAQQTAGTPVGQISVELFDGARELLQRILEQFDIRNPDDILPNLQAAIAASQAQQQGQPLSPVASGAAPLAGAPIGLRDATNFGRFV